MFFTNFFKFGFRHPRGMDKPPYQNFGVAVNANPGFTFSRLPFRKEKKMKELNLENLPKEEGGYLFTPSSRGFYKKLTKIFVFWSNKTRKDLLAFWDEADLASAREEIKERGACSCPPFLDAFEQEGSWEREGALPDDFWE